MTRKSGGSGLRLAAFAVFLAVLVMAAGCKDSVSSLVEGSKDEKPSGGKAAATQEAEWDDELPSGDEKVVLKVMYASESSFYKDYGNLFLSKHPNVEFQVIALSEARGEGDMLENYRAVLKDRRPDVLLMNESQYEALAMAGELADLELPVRKSGFDLENMVPGVPELLKDRGGGKLYGLANTFRSKALYYNKRLFDQYGIPYPKPGMSWEDALQLAKSFAPAETDGEKVYGLYQPTYTVSPFEFVMQIADSRKLAFLNPAGTELMIGSESWEDAFTRVVEGYRDGSLYHPNAPLSDNGDGTMSIRIGNNPFTEGKAAMAVDDLLMMQVMEMMKRVGKKTGEVPEDFPWATVTLPVNPLEPQVTSSFELPEIYAVYAGSGQKAWAWEFIRYIHSEEYMKLVSKSSSELLARSGFERDDNGRDLSAFYALRPDTAVRKPMVPAGFTSKFRKLAEEEMNAAVKGTKTAKEALESLRQRAQEALSEGLLSGDKEAFELGELMPAAVAGG